MNQGIAALGLIVAIGDGASPEVFTPIAEVTDVAGLETKLKTVDNTHLGNIWDEVKATTLALQPMKLTVNFLPSDQTQAFVVKGLGFDMVNRTLRNFKIIYPNAAATAWRFAAFITDFNPKGSVAGKLSADIELTPSGAPALS